MMGLTQKKICRTKEWEEKEVEKGGKRMEEKRGRLKAASTKTLRL